MKRKQLLTKTFLIAAMLIVGVNATWAESLIFTEDFADENYNVTWGGTSAGGVTPAVADGALKVSNGSASGDRSAYIAFGSNANTGCSRLTFDMAMTKSGWSDKNNNFYVLPSATTARYPSTTNAALIVTQDYQGAITIAGESVGTYDGTSLTYDLFLNTVTHSATVIVKNGETTLKTITYETTATGINTMHLTFNKNNGAFAIDNISLYSLTAPAFTLSSTSAAPTVGGTATVDVTDLTGVISVKSDDESKATVSYSEGVITITGVADGVANITVTATNDGLTTSQVIEATVGSVATTTVTVNYKSGSTSIADPLVISDVTVGSTLTASDITYNDVIYGSGVRYVNPTPDKTIPYTVEENGVININYTAQAAVTNVKKIVKAGDTQVSSTDVAQDGKYVGDVIYFSFPAYINYNGTLFTKANNSGTYYSQPFTLTATDQECILSYMITDKINVVYYAEGEDVMTSISTTGNISTRSSNQAAGYSSTDVVLTNLPAGTYKITGNFYKNNSTGDATWKINAGETEIMSFTIASGNASNGSTSSSEFTLSSSANIIAVGGSTDKNAIDYVYIQKTGEVATIGETGWTSFASPYALDLSGIDGGTAYYASSVGEESITMTTTDATVPAGEGLLLKGTAGATVSIPVATTDGTAIEGNKLVGCTSDFTITANTTGYEGFYVLASNEGKAEFQNIKNWVETNNQTVTIPAGKAYIDANRTGSARSLSIVFEEEAVTGIESVQEFKGSKVQGFYDLQGRRVSQPTKGMYIMDGKKVIVK